MFLCASKCIIFSIECAKAQLNNFTNHCVFIAYGDGLYCYILQDKVKLFFNWRKHVERSAVNMEQIIRNNVLLSVMRRSGEGFIPAAISNRHAHLSEQAVDILFGKGYILNKQKELSQPGQFACAETVTLEGPKGKLRLRVLGPARKETQAELSITDARSVGIEPVLRLSGDLANTPGAKLIGPSGHLLIDNGVIVAMRHVHMSAEQAEVYGIKDGGMINLRADGKRGIILENNIVRVGKGHDLELHLDFDEANCAMIQNGDLLKIV